MSEGRTGIARLWAELRRRHVFRTLLAYAAAAFVVLQVGEIVLPAFGLGDWVLQLVVVMSVLGLPVVLALAWVYEITPMGVRTMKELDEEAGLRLEAEGSLLPRVALLAVTLLTATAAGLYWVRISVPDDATAGAGGPNDGAPAVGREGEADGPAFVAGEGSEADVPIRSLVVLPLERFSPPAGADDAEAELTDYFALGMHEALVSRLSQIGTSFRVLSRTTAQAYDRTGKSAARIGQELGVEGIVEGSVVADDGRVRITVQLIHAPSDTHVWAADYEREMEDVLELQRDVSTAIAEAIVGELDRSGDGREPSPTVTAEAPATDPEAAIEEMRGRLALADGGETDFAAAARHFESALREDSTLTPAGVGLAGSRLMTRLAGGRALGEATLDSIEAAAARALEIEPDSREARDVLEVVRRLDGLDGAPPRGGGVQVRVEVEGRPGQDSLLPAPPPHGPRVRFFGLPSTDLGARIQALTASVVGESADPAGLKIEAARGLFAFGRSEQAERLLREVVEERPDADEAWEELEHLLVSHGRVEEVPPLRGRRGEVTGSAAAEGAPPLDSLRSAIRRDGARGYWAWRLAEIEARERAGEEVSRVDRATALVALGENTEALELLRVAAEAEDPDVVVVRGDPTWDPLRGDPRFHSVIREYLQGRGALAPPR